MTMNAIVSALTPEFHVFHHGPCPNEKGGGFGGLINKSLQSKKKTCKKFPSLSSVWMLNYPVGEEKSF